MEKRQKTNATFKNHELFRWLLVPLTLATIAHPSFGESPYYEWKNSTGQTISFPSREGLEEFLRTAAIVEIEGIDEGTTNPRRVLLEHNGVRMRACFRDVRIYKKMERLQSGAVKYDFRDEAVYELAAYELGKLLGLRNIPPTVLRKVKGVNGTLQAWVEDCMMEKDRQKRKIDPPRTWNWVMQSQIIQLFDLLIFNEDRNAGNLLIDPDWKLWLIDHTRAFRTYMQLNGEESIQFCEKNLWARLKTLDAAAVEDHLSPYLNSGQIKSLLRRSALLVEHVQGLIDERGPKRVLFNYPAAVESVTSRRETGFSIRLEANPSEECFPASALQLPELRQDFARVCRGCEVVGGSDDRSADFTVIVTDPGLSWEVVILGRDGSLLKEFRWTGSLTVGLRKAVDFLHQQHEVAGGSQSLTLASSS